MNRFSFTVAALMVALSGGVSRAQVAQGKFTYQGQLTNAGAPANGQYDMQFELLGDPAGLSTFGMVTVPNVTVTNGQFTTPVDFYNVYGLVDGQQSHVRVSVRPTGSGQAFTTLSPNQELTPTPYATYSFAPWVTDANGLGIKYYYWVGLGTSPDASAQLTVRSISPYGAVIRAIEPTDGTTGLYAEATSSSAANSRGVVGVSQNTGSGIGVYGTSPNIGVVGQAAGGANAWGVLGQNTETQNFGVLGSRYSGVYGQTTSSAAYAGQFVNTAPGGIALRADGIAQVKILQILGGSDLAEPFDVNGADVEPGTVVVIDPEHPGQLRPCDQPYDGKVAGVVSGAKGLAPGMVMRAEGDSMADGKHPVAMTGRVWVRCDAGAGAIRPGDQLTTSGTPGHAMRADDRSRAGGAVIGKAMSALPEGTGLVLVLVNLQ